MVWADDGVSLDTAEATFIRAAFESDTIAWITADIDHAYPGYAQALDDDSAFGRYSGGADLTIGYKYDYRAQIADIEDRGGGLWRVRVCNANRVVPPSEQGGKARQSTPGVVSIEFERHDPEPPTDQTGPASAPSRNVFGGWRITNLQRNWEDGDPEKPQVSKVCGDLQPANDLVSPYPGWPA